MMNYRIHLAAFALFSSLATGAEVGAQSLPPNMQVLIQACGSDVKLFCSGIAPGGGRIARCLEANSKRVSASCHTAIAGSLKSVCGPDINRLCAGVAPGNGDIEACLRNHLADLSGTCKNMSDRYAIK